MGEYLKQQYEERDLAKALAYAHGLIDEDYEKLSDKMKILKMSHNRMRNLLRMCLNFLENDGDRAYLYKRIVLELYGSEGYESLKGVKNG